MTQSAVATLTLAHVTHKEKGEKAQNKTEEEPAHHPLIGPTFLCLSFLPPVVLLEIGSTHTLMSRASVNTWPRCHLVPSWQQILHVFPVIYSPRKKEDLSALRTWSVWRQTQQSHAVRTRPGSRPSLHAFWFPSQERSWSSSSFSFVFSPFYHYTVQYYYYGTLFEKWNFVRTAGIPMATRTAHGTALNPEAMRTSHFPRGSSFSSTLSLSFSFLRGIQQLFPSVGRCCVLCHVFPVA